jgi:hypothetical protein
MSHYSGSTKSHYPETNTSGRGQFEWLALFVLGKEEAIMIADAAMLQEVQDGWEFVRESRNIIVGNCNVAAIGALSFNQAAMRNIGFNLLIASGFSVLEQALRQLRDEGSFSGKDNRLGLLMANSRTGLPWVDFPLVDAGRNDRNQSIHARTYMPHEKCRDYLVAIEKELHAWGILAALTPDLWHW